MNHGRQIKRMVRAHHILLKTGDDWRQGLSLPLPLPLTLSLPLYTAAAPVHVSARSLTHSVCVSQTVVWHRASDQ